MIKILINETCRAMGRGQEWYSFKQHEVNADTVPAARALLIAYLDNGIYNVRRPRAPVYCGNIRTGYIYSGIEGHNYLQAWCSFYRTTDGRTLESIDLDNKGDK